jgi:Fe-S-cluster containining protein
MSKTQKAKRKKKALCHHCTGLCCRYFAMPLDTPEDWADYDDMRWYLSHHATEVFVEDGDWYLNVLTACRYLAENHTCSNYELRPKICRGYKTNDCEKTGDDYGYELHFTSDKQMEEYMRVKFGPKVFEKYNAKKKKKRGTGKKGKKAKGKR